MSTDLTAKTRRLGTQGLTVSSLGLGCMGMSFAYGKGDNVESLKLLQASLEFGVNFWDTAELYGPFTNESLLGQALKIVPRDKIVLATKFAWRFDDKGVPAELDSSPKNIKKSIEGSLQRLGTDYIDLYYQHRLDPKTPIEDTMGALGELVRQGKVRYVGLSEVGPATLRKAHRVHPVSALQSEYSLWERGLEEKIIPTLRELGIGLVAYSPLGRGFLTGKIKSQNDLEQGDWRRNNPRFATENIPHNLKLVSVVEEIANRNGVKASQLALAWVLRQGADIVPIPGTKRLSFFKENVESCALVPEGKIPASDWEALTQVLKTHFIKGMRYPEAAMKTLDRAE